MWFYSLVIQLVSLSHGCEQSEFEELVQFTRQVSTPLETALQNLIQNRSESNLDIATERLRTLALELGNAESNKPEVLENIAMELQLQSLHFTGQRILKSDLTQEDFAKILEYKRLATHLFAHLLFDEHIVLSQGRRDSIQKTLVDIVGGQGNLLLGGWLSNLNAEGMTPQESRAELKVNRQSYLARELQRQGMPFLELPAPTLPPSERSTKNPIRLQGDEGFQKWQSNPNQTYDISLLVKDLLKTNPAMVEFFYRDSQFYQNLPSQFEALRILVKMHKAKKLPNETRQDIQNKAERIQTYSREEKNKLKGLIRELR